MITRVTNQTVQHSTLANLQSNLLKMSTLQTQMSSGKKIQVASDDPAAAADMLRLRGEQRVQTQYERSMSDGNSWLTTADSALMAAIGTLGKVRDLTVQGGDSALGATSREALATNIDGLRDTLLAQANTTYLGRTVFAGTSNAGVAFDPATYTFTGSATDSVLRRIADATSVRVDVNGSTAFGSGTTSVFATFDAISAALRGTADTGTFLATLDTHLESMLTELAAVGARQSQVLDAQTELMSTQLTTTTQLSEIEDIDLAEVILQLQSQEVAYKGALGAAQMVLQPSLMDYLR